jgi:glycosyltransferase involved in cell wall biosynthesis
MKHDGISIIICGYNAEKRIVPTLEALQQQKFSDKKISWEVVFVDNVSTDNTAGIANETWSSNPVTDFKIVNEAQPGLMNAREKGLSEAAFEIVSFIDDDNWVEAFWVEKIYEIFSENENIGACGGRSQPVFEKSQPEWFERYQQSFAVGRQADSSGVIDNAKGFLWGAGLSFRKKLWVQLKNKGFQNLTVGREGKNINAGEDTELCFAIRLLGFNLYYKEDLLLKHYMPESRMNFEYLEKMAAGFGKAYARLNCYRVLLNPGTFNLNAWWYEWLVAEKNILMNSIRLFFNKNNSAVQYSKYIRAYNKGYARQVWEDKSLAKEINRLKKIFYTN